MVIMLSMYPMQNYNFSRKKKRLKPFELKTVLFEVYVEILRMLHIPFTEWLREYWQCILIRRETLKQKKGQKLSRVSFESQDQSDMSSNAQTSSESNSKYRKVFHVREDFRIEWKVVKYNTNHSCINGCSWFCYYFCSLFGYKSTTNKIVLGNNEMRTSRPSIVLRGMPKEFRSRQRESFIQLNEC